MLGTNTDRVRAGNGATLRAGATGGAGGAGGDGGRRALRQRLLADAAVLFGLAGLAVTQPLLELFGDNPTFFVAGRYGRRQIVAFGLLVAVMPGLVAALVSAPFRLVGARAGAVAHGVAVGALAGAFGLMVCRTLGVDHVAAAGTGALGLAALTAGAEARWRPARRFLAYLALGNVAFLVAFLVLSPTGATLRASSRIDRGTVTVPELAGPVLVVVFDELPLTALLRPDGTINDARYPNVARLAAGSTWFRDAASESSLTYVSIPTLLTGVRARDDQVPTSRDHPRNLFTLFGDAYPAHRYSPVTDMCPHDVCPGPPPGTLGGMLADVSVVYRHRVLPAALRDGLPPVDNSWGRFGDGVGVQAASTASGGVNLLAQIDEIGVAGLTPAAQLDALVDEVRHVGPEPSVGYVHVMVPHTPYLLTPWGGTNADTWEPHDVPARPDDHAASVYRDVAALQALQIGAVDAALGEVIDHLEQAGAWDDALVVVTSDHGIDTTPPTFGRDPDGSNHDELLRIPLFVKVPGQTEGEVRDEPASIVDVLPSIMDLLGIEADWRLEGHSLFDGSEPTVERLVDSTFADAVAVAERRAGLFPEGDGWAALAAVGPAAGLVGDPVTDHVVGDPSPLRWSPDRRDLLDDLATDGAVPYLMLGTVEGADAPVELVVALNGRIAGAVESYAAEDESWRVSGVMAPHFRDGRNDVVAYEVERSGGRVVLHPLAER